METTDDGEKQSVTGPETVELENDFLKLTLLPSIGGKITQLVNRQTGTQFLYEGSPDHFPIPEYGDTFNEQFAYGFDECFPTVSPCTYEEGTDIDLPDHGELWSQAWEYEADKRSIKLWTEGNRFEYLFTRHITLEDNTVVIDYSMTNKGEFPFRYIWSSHPLLNVTAGDKLVIGDEVKEVMVNWTSDPKLGDLGEWISWPECSIDGQLVDLSQVQNPSLSFAGKFFTQKLKKGKVGLFHTKSDEALMLSFDTSHIPYLGIWLCYGGWPDGQQSKEHTVALEPCSGRPDSLLEACRRGENSEVLPSETHQWKLKLTLLKTKNDMEISNMIINKD